MIKIITPEEGLIMTGENQLCVYWLDNVCTLSDIHLDNQGNCGDCLQIELTEKELKEVRERTLNRYDPFYFVDE